MNVERSFRAAVERYLRAAKMDPTTFGRLIMNDGNFVFDIREGRSPRANTVDMVNRWMAANPVKTEKVA